MAKTCPNCGAQLENNVCPYCGYQEKTTGEPVNADINAGKKVEFWLCLFLGFYGVHKFYEGKIGVGLLYFFTGGLFGVGWIIDVAQLAGEAFKK